MIQPERDETVLLIARAPVRISFGGGGTDLPAYYETFGGMVISTSINHYVYTILSSNTNNSLQIISADYQVFHRQPITEGLIWSGDLALPKAIIHEFGLQEGLNVFLASLIPPGTGLGSSGAVAVSMVTALNAWCGEQWDRQKIAELACAIEIEKMNMPVGKQDQYASAFGGLNEITFTAEGTTVRPLAVSSETLEQLQQNLLLFFTGTSRRSSSILKHQRRASQEQHTEVIARLHTIKELAETMREALLAGDLEAFGRILHQSWLNKQGVAPGISNDRIDACYAVARSAGAVGGKITGAGGGGFMLLYCPEPYQTAVTDVLQQAGLHRMDFKFDFEGAQVTFSNHPTSALDHKLDSKQIAVCGKAEGELSEDERAGSRVHS